VASQLSLYNAALRHLGQRKLSATTDDVEARYVLDDEYSTALVYCLRQGTWNFALEENSIASASATGSSVTYGNRFAKPADWVRTRDISSSSTFDPPLTDFVDMAGYWYASSSIATLYVRFVSSTPGILVANFPSDYAEYVSAYLAWLVYRKVTGGNVEERAIFAETVLDPALRMALANDALDGKPTSQKAKMLTEIRAVDSLVRGRAPAQNGGA
jgi:hypothetical protein